MNKKAIGFADGFFIIRVNPVGITKQAVIPNCIAVRLCKTFIKNNGATVDTVLFEIKIIMHMKERKIWMGL